MDIRLLDVDDDAAVERSWQVARAGELYGREDQPYWTLATFAGYHRSARSTERRLGLCAFDGGGTQVGSAVVELPLQSNTTKAYGGLTTHPAHRNRGVGSAMLEHLIGVCERHRRAEIIASTIVPRGARDHHPYRRFAENRGFSLANIEVERHLRLPADPARLDRLEASVTGRHRGYRIETFRDRVPDELVESLCALTNLLIVDAPTGDVAFEPEARTPQTYAEHRDDLAAERTVTWETLAVDSAGTAVAQTTLALSLDDPATLRQWGTYVHRDHRGHGLGMATKIANLRAACADRPEATVVTTQNAETNPYMVGINVALGFEVVEEHLEFLRRL